MQNTKVMKESCLVTLSLELSDADQYGVFCGLAKLSANSMLGAGELLITLKTLCYAQTWNKRHSYGMDYVLIEKSADRRDGVLEITFVYGPKEFAENTNDTGEQIPDWITPENRGDTRKLRHTEIPGFVDWWLKGVEKVFGPRNANRDLDEDCPF